MIRLGVEIPDGFEPWDTSKPVPHAESAHKEWIVACRRKFRGIEENQHAKFIDVPSWMWSV